MLTRKPYLYIRYLKPDSFEWEEACLQFQACNKALSFEILRILKKKGFLCRREKDRVYAQHIQRKTLDKIIQDTVPKHINLVDIDTSGEQLLEKADS